MNAAKLKRSLKLLGRSVGLEVSVIRDRGNENLPGYVGKEFEALYRKYYSNTMVPWSGLYTAYQAVQYIAERGITGDIVECGVWKGGCSALMIEALKNRGITDRHIWLYDTFEGMTEPTDKDTHFAGAQNAVESYEKYQRQGVKWSHGPMEDAKEAISKTGYDPDKIHFIKGDVLKTLQEKLPKKIALLRLDTDWYESTKMEMEKLFPLLEKNGVFICDDYGSWKGSYDAVNEYFQAQGIHLFLQIDPAYGGACGVKS